MDISPDLHFMVLGLEGAGRVLGEPLPPAPPPPSTLPPDGVVQLSNFVYLLSVYTMLY